MENEDIEQIKSETLDAIMELESYIEILSAYVDKYASSTPFVHANLIVQKMRELMDIIMENQDVIFH